jgi:hypothetical protein
MFNFIKCLLVLLIVPLFGAHPFYLSVTDLKFNDGENALQGSVKIFVNDLEGAVNKFSGKKVDLIHPADTSATRKILSDYLDKKIRIRINGVPKSVSVVGFEHESENLWIYVEIHNVIKPKSIVVENTLLYERLKEQINIVQIQVHGVQKSTRLVNPEKTAAFIF